MILQKSVFDLLVLRVYEFTCENTCKNHSIYLVHFFVTMVCIELM